MNKKIVVCGFRQNTYELIESVMQLDLPIEIQWLANDFFNEDKFKRIKSASQLLSKTTVSQGDYKDCADADMLVLADHHSIIEEDDDPNAYLAEQLPEVRKSINQMMAEGFNGKICVVMPDDEQVTYFAWRFSGIPKQHIFGLGTFGSTLKLQRRLQGILSVGQHDVRAYVFGTQRNPIILWSRAYIGVSPILGFMAKDDNDFSVESINELEELIGTFSSEESAITNLMALAKVLRAVYCEESFISTFTTIQSLQNDNDTLLAYCQPVLVNNDGVKLISSISGTEAENQARTDVATQILQRYSAIENGVLGSDNL